jgi:hypothetical protein
MSTGNALHTAHMPLNTACWSPLADRRLLPGTHTVRREEHSRVKTKLLEALLATRGSVAKRGADEIADRYMIENREAAVGVQVFRLRQRWGAAICRAQTQVLLGRLKCALPGWEEAESRRAADTAAEASCRSHARGSGARGFDADSWGAGYGGTWVAPTGTPAARALGCGGRTSCGCVVDAHRVRAEPACREGRVRGFGGGALRCLAGSESPSQPPPPNFSFFLSSTCIW